VVTGYDTETEYPRFISEGYPFSLSGKNIGFDAADEDLSTRVGKEIYRQTAPSVI
jgi:hypothetical protein